MTAEEVYKKTKEEGLARREKIASEILLEIEKRYGKIPFPFGMDSMNKIYQLLINGNGYLVEDILLEKGYHYEPELQYILANLGYFAHTGEIDSNYMMLLHFPSVHNIMPLKNQYVIDSKLGRIYFTPLNKWDGNLQISRYASLGSSYHYCHESTLEFLKLHPEYEAITSLIPDQFGAKQYHSYISIGDSVADFSHNAYLSKDDFNLIMKPLELNHVHGYELEEEEKSLTSDDLGVEKNLLVRLAVSRQRKM